MPVYKLQNPKWNEDKLIIVCDCSNAEHQLGVSYWPKDNENEPLYFYFSPHLHTHKSIFKRLWHAIKYVFGHKSKYGAFDELLITEDDVREIVMWFESHLDE